MNTDMQVKAGKNIILKNCASLRDLMTAIKNPQIDNAKNLYTMIQMQNLLRYSENCGKPYGTLRQ